MSLKTLTSILKSGNIALLEKLHRLLTEDCNILEYTDDAVLFQKNNYLVIAKFKHDLTESKLNSDDILDNEVLYISAKETEREIKESLVKLVDDLVEDDYVSAEEGLKSFCETFYRFQILKLRFPETFTENLVKKSPGFSLRKAGNAKISEFKSDLFSLVTLNDHEDLDVSEYATIIENFGSVLFLGKEKVITIVEEAVLGNKKLAESITDKLFETAKTLNEVNEDISHAMNNDYNLEDGKYKDENTDNEDYNAPDEMESDFPQEEEGKHDFEEFDPSTLSDEEIKELHKTVLTSILSGMSEFISREANNPDNGKVSADLDDRLKNDLEILNNPELADDELSDVEARWHPILDYFLDSDLYTPDQDLGAEEVEIQNEDGGENPESIEEPEAAPEEMGNEIPGQEPMPGKEEPEVQGMPR